MKPIILSLLHILACTLIANAQLAIIKDPDGFTNVRKDKNITSKIIGKFHDGDVFGYGEEQNGWVNAYYFPADSGFRGIEGYIHNDRLQPLDKLPHLSKKDRTQTKGRLTLHNDSLTVELLSAPFLAKQHVLHKENNNIVTIDGKRPLGSDGEMPLEKLTGFRVTIKNHAIDIPATAWNNLYDPTLESCEVYTDPRTGFMYIYMNSYRSAAGGYEIAWIFKNGQYVNHYVDQSNN